jgi:hypothetical protein
MGHGRAPEKALFLRFPNVLIGWNAPSVGNLMSRLFDGRVTQIIRIDDGDDGWGRRRHKQQNLMDAAEARSGHTK